MTGMSAIRLSWNPRNLLPFYFSSTRGYIWKPRLLGRAAGAHLLEVPGGGAEKKGRDDHEAGVVEEHSVLPQLLRQETPLSCRSIAAASVCG